MFSTSWRHRPASRVLGGIAVATLAAITLAACAKKAPQPTTGLGTIPTEPTPALSAGNGQGGVGGGAGQGSPSPHTSPSHPTTSPSTSGGPPTLPPPPSPVFPTLTNEDCINYNPATTAVVSAGVDGYKITDGSSSMLLLDNLADANTALQLVRNYNKQCFIGRNNTRTGNDRYRYIVDYWKGTGVPAATVPTPDCLSYDNNAVAAHNIGADGWQVTAGSQALVILDSQADATNAVALAHLNHHICFIGRDNTRPKRAEYIVEYWTP